MRDHVRLARRFALAFVLVGLSAAAAQAQDYNAKFTLPFEVRWSGAVLPAGEYRLSMKSIQGPMSVIDASGRVRALVYGTPDAPATEQPNELLVTRDGAVRTVRSFNCPDLGRKYVYEPLTRAERNRLANREDTVRVRMASR